jgi:hypothetical protein
MSWQSPTNWSETISSVAAGYSFNAKTLKVRGNYIAVLTDVRRDGALYGHLDDFAREIIAANERQTQHYMSGNGRFINGNDIVYYVSRDGNALAYVTRDGQVRINERAVQGLPRYADAINRLMPALEAYAAKRIVSDQLEDD